MYVVLMMACLSPTSTQNSVVVQACNPNIQEMEVGASEGPKLPSQIEASLGYTRSCL